MAQNIMNEYIKLTKEHMNRYMKLILRNDFDSSIFDEFWESYLNARYYDLNGYKSDNTLKEEILLELNKKKDKLKERHSTKRKLIEDMYLFLNHLIYFDKISPNKDLEKTIEDINYLCKELLGREENSFKDTLRESLMTNTKEVEELLKKFECQDFYISISNYRTIKNVYRVNLKYNFRMPMVYSNLAINKAFTTGTVNEDKLFIEYSLISIQIIQDIIRGNFKKQYVVEFADSLFEKGQKLERVLKTVENQAIQDKLNFKIEYNTFLENKMMVYDFIKRGFRFAVIIDEKFDGTLESIEKLKVFSYVMINENAKWYHHIVEGIDSKYIIEV